MSAEDREKWDRRYHEGAYADRTEPAVWLAESLPAIKHALTQRAQSEPRALDLACGAGRNSGFLLREGFSVDGVDISPIGLSRARRSAEQAFGDSTGGSATSDPAVLRRNRGDESPQDKGGHGGKGSNDSGHGGKGINECAHGKGGGQATSNHVGDRIRFFEHDLDQPLAPVLGSARYDLIVVMRYLNPRLFTELPRLLRPGGEVMVEVHLKTSTTVSGPSSDRFRVAPGALADHMHAAGLETVLALEGLIVDPDGKRMAVARYRGRLAYAD